MTHDSSTISAFVHASKTIGLRVCPVFFEDALSINRGQPIPCGSDFGCIIPLCNAVCIVSIGSFMMDHQKSYTQRLKVVECLSKYHRIEKLASLRPSLGSSLVCRIAALEPTELRSYTDVALVARSAKREMSVLLSLTTRQ